MLQIFPKDWVPTISPVLNQPSASKAALVSSGRRQYLKREEYKCDVHCFKKQNHSIKIQRKLYSLKT
jgi:hypothetical protein